MNPLVSIVMPAYNAAWSISRSIDSVLTQSYSEFELLIVDDCSKDNTLEIVRQYAQRDSRIRVIVCGENRGVAAVRNEGIAQAKGTYIALLDSDDVWLPDKLQRQMQLLKDTGAEIAYCSYDFIDEKDAPVLKPFLVPESTNYRKMLYSSVISCSTAVVEAKLMKQHPFRSQWYHEDYVLWMELLKIPVKAVGVQEVLAHYRQVEGSRSNHKGNAAIERWKIYRKALGMNVFSSAVAFIGYALNGIRKYYFCG